MSFSASCVSSQFVIWSTVCSHCLFFFTDCPWWPLTTRLWIVSYWNPPLICGKLTVCLIMSLCYTTKIAFCMEVLSYLINTLDTQGLINKMGTYSLQRPFALPCDLLPVVLVPQKSVSESAYISISPVSKWKKGFIISCSFWISHIRMEKSADVALWDSQQLLAYITMLQYTLHCEGKKNLCLNLWSLKPDGHHWSFLTLQG